MSWVTIGAGVFGAWVLLLILSGERQHRTDELSRQAARYAEQVAEAVHEVR